MIMWQTWKVEFKRVIEAKQGRGYPLIGKKYCNCWHGYPPKAAYKLVRSGKTYLNNNMKKVTKFIEVYILYLEKQTTTYKKDQ